MDDKDCLSVCSHFSCSDDDELIIRKGPCQINLKKTATKKSTAERDDMATQWDSSGKKGNRTFSLRQCCGGGGMWRLFSVHVKCLEYLEIMSHVHMISRKNFSDIMKCDWQLAISTL